LRKLFGNGWRHWDIHHNFLKPLKGKSHKKVREVKEWGAITKHRMVFEIFLIAPLIPVISQILKFSFGRIPNWNLARSKANYLVN
jgi:hypothetical protein